MTRASPLQHYDSGVGSTFAPRHTHTHHTRGISGSAARNDANMEVPADPSLAYFIQRAQVLGQYRELMRLARTMDPGVMDEVRRSYRVHRSAEPERVQFLLSQGGIQMKMMQDIAIDILAPASSLPGARSAAEADAANSAAAAAGAAGAAAVGQCCRHLAQCRR